MRLVLVASENFEMFRIFDLMQTNEVSAKFVMIVFIGLYHVENELLVA